MFWKTVSRREQNLITAFCTLFLLSCSDPLSFEWGASSSNCGACSLNFTSLSSIQASLGMVEPLVRATFELSDTTASYPWDPSSLYEGSIEQLRISGNGYYETVTQLSSSHPSPRCGAGMVELSIEYPEIRAEVTPARELALAYGAPRQQNATYIFSLFLDEGYFSDAYAETIAQWHTWQYFTDQGALAYASPDAQIVKRNDSLLFIVRTTDQLASSEPGEKSVKIATKEHIYALDNDLIPVGRWVDIAPQASWSYHSNAAYLKLYIDGELVVNHSGPNAIRVPTNAPPFFKTGIYNKWSKNEIDEKKSYLPRRMWLDEVYVIPAIVDAKHYRSCE